MTNNPYIPGRQQGRWKPTVLFWIVAAVLLLVLIPFAIVGGLGIVLFLLGLVALLTGLYALLFKRRSWVGLPHRKSGGLVAVAGFVVFALGSGIVGATAAPREDTDKATLVSPVQKSATATPTPTPTATNPANSKCTTAAATQKYNSQTYVCTTGSDERLVWMTESDSKRVLAAKAAAEKAAAEKAAAEKAAAEQAAAEKAAAEQAAAEKAAADKAAADAAAAQQAAAQQAAKPAPAPAAPAPAVPAPAVPAPAAPAPASVYYANCAAAKAAGAAPVRAGMPGYGTHLDRDGDGIGCEK
ncbi:excalibur calcium-binding domain-containing protein [Pseudarthrobacter siccitolerans]|uniref:excalibur calcium-binding domain-containing protein n=1 Tax=Pseudarthrobacter siccitolerans TaxID=861266 RepID=UPI000ABB84D8